MARVLTLDVARAKAAAIFRGVSAPSREVGRLVDLPGGALGALSFMDGRTPKGIQHPGLLYFALRQLLDLPDFECGDKVRWSVMFEFEGSCFAFECRKSGLRFMREDVNLDDALAERVHCRARGVVGVAAKYLADVQAPLQLRSGDVMIPNHFLGLDERYRFFRERALATFRAAPVVTFERVTPIELHALSEAHANGGHLAIACVGAFFSRLEHLFVLSLGFVGDVVEKGGLLGFLESSWTKKATTQLGLATDPKLQEIYDELLVLRREWRNPAAHGGFKRRGESFWFNVSGVGALPVVLSTSDGQRVLDVSPSPVPFSEALRTFDRFDDAVEEGVLRYTMMWARAGLDLPLDRASREGMRAATSTQEDFEAMIEGVEIRIDMESNAEL